ncbi:centromere protein O-like [Actinia tenebrosa]|uniref:Centromere protein O n=1 Tax=Actinia tenebrosa TaxID=6105 RepID=A0A6P8HKT8_ACTTE|nr:centromere protein O-like [Actinia tenebrosa]
MADKMKFKEGALETLEKLQKAHEKLAAEQDLEAQEKKEIAYLKKRVQQLKKKRNQLSQQLQNDYHQVIQDYVQHSDNPDYLKELTDSEKEEILNAAYALRCKKLRDLCDAYRLAGVSIESEYSSKINFRLDIFNGGQHHDTYYIEIQSGDQLKISRHTLPYVIPITAIEKNFLNTDVQAFFTELLKELNIFASQKEKDKGKMP